MGGTMRVLLSLIALLLVSAVQAQDKPPEKPLEKPPEKQGYAGSETCQVCHEDIAAAFRKSPHGVVETQKRRGWEGRACESCHGPGAKHAETADAANILNPAKLNPAKADAGCLSCHTMQPTHVGRVHGSHGKNQVACVSCHSVHAPKPALTNRLARINTQCGACHTTQRASFQRPYGHRINQGAMSCADCHNPHGTQLTAMLRLSTGGEPGCLNCHGDKRGPFAYEHAPVRLEGCQSCHEPHGSANPRMLTRPTVSQLCLECHAGITQPGGGTNTGVLGGIPPGFHDLRSARFRNCTICHTKVHGSHVSRALLK